MTIRYDPNFPAAMSAIIRPLIEKWAPIVCPAWVNEISVWSADAGVNEIASCTPYREYRKLSLTFDSCFLTNVPNDQMDAYYEKVVLHELMHAYTAPTKMAATQAFSDFFPDGETPGTRIATRHVTEAMEGATEDLAILVKKLVLQS